VAFPIVAYCCYDYIYGLKGLEYGTEEYRTKQKEIHKVVAGRLFYMSNHCGGIYFKAGQYLGTLERLAPKEYTETLKTLQERGAELPFEQVKVVYEHDMGCKIEDAFSEIDILPVASASLAQVHRAILKDTGEEVAVKLQYPQLKVQTKIDLLVLKFLIHMSYRVAQYYDNQAIDFRRFNNHFNQSIVKELDFKQEVVNLERTRNNFKGYAGLYLPRTYVMRSSRRTIVMEFCRGARIDDLDKLQEQFGEKGPQKASNILVDVFAKMIFVHGFVHCDAHPGNIMVRPNPKKPSEPQIVLLDHGFYCQLKHDFREDFCQLWYALNTFNYLKVKAMAEKLGMGQYFRYLPLLFTYRTINAKKPLGGSITKEEIAFLKGNDEVNFEKVSLLLQELPTEVVFIFKAMHVIGLHNRRSGGTTRERLIKFTDLSIQGVSQSEKYSPPYEFMLRMGFRLKLLIFERLFWLYRALYGFKEYNIEHNSLEA